MSTGIEEKALHASNTSMLAIVLRTREKRFMLIHSAKCLYRCFHLNVIEKTDCFHSPSAQLFPPDSKMKWSLLRTSLLWMEGLVVDLEGQSYDVGGRRSYENWGFYSVTGLNLTVYVNTHIQTQTHMYTHQHKMHTNAGTHTYIQTL